MKTRLRVWFLQSSIAAEQYVAYVVKKEQFTVPWPTREDKGRTST